MNPLAETIEPLETTIHRFDGDETVTPQTEPALRSFGRRRAITGTDPGPAPGLRLMDSVRETVELLAASYVADGKSIPDAARLAVEQLVTSDNDLVEELRAESALGQRPRAVGRTAGLDVAAADPFGRAGSDAVASDDRPIDARFDVRDKGSSDRRAVQGAIEGSPVAQSGLPPTPKRKPIVPPLPQQKPVPPLDPSTIRPLTPAEVQALRGAVVLTPANDPLPQSHIPLQFRNMIAERESTALGGYQAYNPSGKAWGRVPTDAGWTKTNRP